MTAQNLSRHMISLLTAIDAGEVSGTFSSQYNSPRWSMVPAIEGTRVGSFHHLTATGALMLITDEVVKLIAAGYVTAERAGEFYTITAPESIRAGLDWSATGCDVIPVLTAAGHAVATAASPARKRTARRPSAIAKTIAEFLTANPIQATTVDAENLPGFTQDAIDQTVSGMVAAGDVIATADFDGTPIYFLARTTRARYALAA